MSIFIALFLFIFRIILLIQLIFLNIYAWVIYTLFRCPGEHPILHQDLKLNSKISAGKYKKKNSPRLNDFPLGDKPNFFWKKCRDSIKRVVTLAKLQGATKHLTIFFFLFFLYSWQGIYIMISISTYHDLILAFSQLLKS